MTEPISFGELDFKLTTSMEETPGVPDPEAPFQIAVLGDFSGRISQGKASQPQKLAAIQIDRDNLDEVMQQLKVAVRLHLPQKSEPLIIQFSEIDDFHPDSLYDRLEIFQPLKKLRRELNEPATFDRAAAEVRSWLKKREVPEHSDATPQQESPGQLHSPAPAASGASSEGLLDRIIEETPPQTYTPEHRPQSDASGLRSFLQELVAPYIVPTDNPQLEQLVAAVDDVISGIMRAIINHQDFKAIESGWRSLNFLVSRLETGTDLKLFIVDISKEELSADLRGKLDLRGTASYKLFVEQSVETYGSVSWTLLAGNFAYGASQEDAEFLGRMAKIAYRAGAPFITQASDQLLGCQTLTGNPDPCSWQITMAPDVRNAWEALRKLPEASALGLALPRFLLRLPYGETSDPIDRFDFEELTADSDHEAFLWGNPIVAITCLLGRNFSQNGWKMQPSRLLDLENLPLHISKEKGETKTTPCAEVMLTENAASHIIDKGFMPLLSFLNQDKIRLGRFQSFADPPKNLKGRWG